MIWIPELGLEGAVSGPHELSGTPAALEEPLGSPGASEQCPSEGSVVEIADSK